MRASPVSANAQSEPRDDGTGDAGGIAEHSRRGKVDMEQEILAEMLETPDALDTSDVPEALEALLTPISDEHPGGEDLSYSTLYGYISEARRAEDPSLTQGDWVAPLKIADWDKARQLCEAALRARSKDLQLAVWYAEAMTHAEGYAGAALGFRLVTELLRRYQETLHPLDPEERIAKLEWLNTALGHALRLIPLTVSEHGGYNWYHWQESREVQNLQRRGKADYERAINDKKLTPEAFDKSAHESGIDWFRNRLDALGDAHAAYVALAMMTNECFKENAPALSNVSKALDDCIGVAQRMFEECGGAPPPSEAPTQTPDVSDAQVGRESPESSAPSGSPRAYAAGPVASRAEAVRQLREVARYFRETEPHSPVAHLVERAAKWAEMPLEHWLKTVIKDEATLKNLRELLDISGE
jgi:type VI secretion system protein ImpA